MKTRFSKIISAILVFIMLVSAIPFTVFAANSPNCVIDVTQLSKEGNTITAAIDLTSGTFNSIDLAFEMSGLVCKFIEKGSFPTDSDVLFVCNPSSKTNNIAMISYDGIAPGNLAVVTLEVTDDSYSFNVKATACCVTDGKNIDVEPEITNNVSGFEHRYSSAVTDPTCTQKGYTTYTCPCGDSYIGDYVDETGHTPGEWEITVPPTSLKDGSKQLTCGVCTAVIDTELIPKFGSVQSVAVDDISLQYKSSAEIIPEIVADSGVEYTVTYSSSDSDIAYVDENGEIYAAGKGSAEITVTVTDEYGNVATDTATVEVRYVWWQWIIVILLFGWIWY
ncbi:MAG: Ig-like domain-containing protein [Clostridia bacterium]|nr:Ig-like domain-containing protein [Clostridia bacterium]